MLKAVKYKVYAWHASSLEGICVTGVVLNRASPHPPRHFVVDVFHVLLVFLSVGLLQLLWEMFSNFWLVVTYLIPGALVYKKGLPVLPVLRYLSPGT